MIIYSFQLFCIISTLISISPQKLVKYDYKAYFGGYYAYLTLGNPSKTILHGIDQGLTVTWTDISIYNYHNSSTASLIKEWKLKFQHLHLPSQEIEETIHFNTTENSIEHLSNFPLFVTNSTRGYNSRVGGIGLAFKFTDTKYSLVHQLKENKIINKLLFSIVPNSSLNGSLYIGGVPSIAIKDKKVTMCPIVGTFAHWACDLSYIFFGDISYVYENIYYNNFDYAYFQNGEGRILAPMKFIKYLNECHFNDMIKGGKCINELYGMNFRFKCKEDVIGSFGNINFVFNSYAFTFNMSRLFQKDYGDMYNFLIVSNHIRSNNWIFGNVFLENFVTVFDYEEKNVKFYSNKEIVYIDLEKIFPWKKIVRIGGFTLGVPFAIVVLFCIGIRLKNSKKRKMDLLLYNIGEELK